MQLYIWRSKIILRYWWSANLWALCRNWWGRRRLNKYVRYILLFLLFDQCVQHQSYWESYFKNLLTVTKKCLWCHFMGFLPTITLQKLKFLQILGVLQHIYISLCLALFWIINIFCPTFVYTEMNWNLSLHIEELC